MVWKLNNLARFPLFFWVSQISSYFLGLPILYHTLESFEWRTHSTEKHKIIVAFHFIQTLTNIALRSFYFYGFEFRVILFFWVVEICSRASIPVKEMLVCPPPPPGSWTSRATCHKLKSTNNAYVIAHDNTQRAPQNMKLKNTTTRELWTQTLLFGDSV